MAILVSKVMTQSLRAAPGQGLERSCGAPAGDWIRHAPGAAGPDGPTLERIEARFGGHAYDPHRHDSYAIGYTVAGAQAFGYRGSAAVSRAGNLIVLHPDERHDGHAVVEGGFVYRMLYLQPRLVRAALEGRADALPFAPQPVSDDSRLGAALRLALEDLERPLEPLQADAAILAIAEALLALDGAGGRGSRTSSAPAVERARALLAAEAHRTVESAELEAASGLSRYELARQFRRRLGTSPYRYLTLRRLDLARRLIRTGHSLAETAAASGFADQSHLTRQFRAAFGLSPGRWRSMLVGP